MQFMGNIFMIVGAGVFLLSLNIRLGSAALLPGIIVLIITRHGPAVPSPPRLGNFCRNPIASREKRVLATRR